VIAPQQDAPVPMFDARSNVRVQRRCSEPRSPQGRRGPALASKGAADQEPTLIATPEGIYLAAFSPR
jgi:hypothetical protein